MRSRAQFKGHPIHPAIVPFPFAFLTGGLLFDLIGTFTIQPGLSETGAYLTIAGLAAGLLAAVPGVIDYLHSVPPESSAKTRATRHAALNVSALVLFALAFATRDGLWHPTIPTLAIELLGAALLVYAGWLGGTLVTRNLISVDHRYAQLGKWQEAELTTQAGAPVVVAHVNDLKENQMKLLHVNGRRLVLARTAAGYRAFDDRCTHRGGSLAGGVLICGTVQCLWHGSQFDVSSGAVTCGPASLPIRTYEIEERTGGEVVLVSPPG
jgi:uncharacterized membrane protein/nitrite reductase/ring-hydroxylating ferredoxin subunit